MNNLDGILGNVDTSSVHEDTSTEYTSWTDTWMQVCKIISKRSKDPIKKVGALIVDKDNKIISYGYNGMPRVMDGVNNDTIYPWTRENEDPNFNKKSYEIHAELNAILNANQSLKDCTLYVTSACCNECCKAIVQSGIKEVVYIPDDPYNLTFHSIGRDMLRNADIRRNEYTEKI